jgi:hypothetical protein
MLDLNEMLNFTFFVFVVVTSEFNQIPIIFVLKIKTSIVFAISNLRNLFVTSQQKYHTVFLFFE